MKASTISSDEELMTAYQAGDASAFEILFQRHSGKVYGFLVGRIRDRMEAQDVLQTTFLKLHQSRQKYDPRFPFLPWLFTICKNVMIDHFRKAKRRMEILDEEKVAGTAAEPAPEISVPELQGLSLQQRSAIELRFQYELSFEEIAERLQTSSLNVRQLISRGLKKIRGAQDAKKGKK